MPVLEAIWTVSWKIVAFLVLWGFLLAPSIPLFGSTARGSGGALSPKTTLWAELPGALAAIAAWDMLRSVDRRS